MARLLTAFLLFVSLSLSAEEIPDRLTLVGPKGPKVFSLAQLKSKLKPATVTVANPDYGNKTITYEGFWLSDVMKLGELATEGADELWFQCADGYTPVLPFEKLSRLKLLVAYREKGGKARWTRVRQGKKLLSPGPFYVVASTVEQFKDFNWPYQVVHIETIRLREKLPKIFPDGAAPDSAAARGFATFRGQCLRCHSINLEGGDLGPELNYPKNITEYWDEKVMKDFIKDPLSFRAKSTMPSFPALTDRDIDDLVAYLKHMKGRKQGP